MNDYDLSRKPVKEQMINNQHVWPLIVNFASFIDGLRDEIFVFQMFPGTLRPDKFQCIASLPQLRELTTEPLVLENTQIPFYLRSTLRLDCRSLQESDERWEIVKFDVDALVRNFKLGEKMEQPETVGGT